MLNFNTNFDGLIKVFIEGDVLSHATYVKLLVKFYYYYFMKRMKLNLREIIINYKENKIVI